MSLSTVRKLTITLGSGHTDARSAMSMHSTTKTREAVNLRALGCGGISNFAKKMRILANGNAIIVPTIEKERSFLI